MISALNNSRDYSYAEITEIRRDRREDFESRQGLLFVQSHANGAKLMRRRHELSIETILWLQTTCGNRAVQRLLLRKGLTRTNRRQPQRRLNWWQSIRRRFGRSPTAS